MLHNSRPTGQETDPNPTLAACRWAAGRLAGFQDFASNARRPLENGAYADVIEEIRAELERVLALAEDER
jgi:hypothetical protein